MTPDHLDRHGDMAGYIAAKKRIFAGQDEASTVVIGIDDEICRDIAEALRRHGKARVVPISVTEKAPGGVYVESGWLVDALDGRPERVFAVAGSARACRARTTPRTPRRPMPWRAAPGSRPRRQSSASAPFPGSHIDKNW